MLNTSQLILDGTPLDFKRLYLLGSGKVIALADDTAMEKVKLARDSLEGRILAGQPIYGSTTGVGAMKDVEWTPSQLNAFNLGLVRAHHFGTGDPFPTSIVRAAIAIRVNTALSGHVGVTTGLLESYLKLLAADVIPVVRRTGSIGCADIGLMGQIGAVLTGVGEAHYRGARLPAAEALQKAGVAPHILAPRDSLASISTNAVGYAAGAEAVRGAASVLRILLATGLTTAGALGASTDPWRAVSEVGTSHEAMIGSWLERHAQGWDWPKATHVQDPLSLRMMGQVFGTAFYCLILAGQSILTATGRTDDNPIVSKGMVLTSGGSLPLAVTLFLQNAQLALAHVARNSFNRCVLLGNGGRRGLPVNLVPYGEIATGFGPIIKLAGDLYARVLSLSSSISAQALVVAGGVEDEAAFLPLVVERFERQVLALQRLAALEGILAAQAMDLAGDRPGGVTKFIYELVRESSAFYSVDRPLSEEVEMLEAEMNAEKQVARLISHAPLDEIDNFFALGSI